MKIVKVPFGLNEVTYVSAMRNFVRFEGVTSKWACENPEAMDSVIMAGLKIGERLGMIKGFKYGFAGCAIGISAVFIYQAFKSDKNKKKDNPEE